MLLFRYVILVMHYASLISCYVILVCKILVSRYKILNERCAILMVSELLETFKLPPSCLQHVFNAHTLLCKESSIWLSISCVCCKSAKISAATCTSSGEVPLDTLKSARLSSKTSPAAS